MCLDASTIDPAVSKSMSELVHGLGNGCVFAEAPVSGGFYSFLYSFFLLLLLYFFFHVGCFEGFPVRKLEP